MKKKRIYDSEAWRKKFLNPLAGAREHAPDARRKAVASCDMLKFDAELAATRTTFKLQTHDQPHPAST